MLRFPMLFYAGTTDLVVVFAGKLIIAAPAFLSLVVWNDRDNVIAGNCSFIEDRYTSCDLCADHHRKIIFCDADKIIFAVPCFYAEISHASPLPLFIISPFLRRSPAS